MAEGLPDGFVLRDAVDDDAAAVRAVVFEVLAEYGLKAEPEGVDGDLFDLSANYAGSGGWFAVLVEGGGRIVGTVGLKPVGDGSVELRKMYLLASMRGRGLGRRMLTRALEQARRLGFRKVVLGTATVLRDAVRLYERHGFRAVPLVHGASRCNQAMEIELASESGRQA